MKRYLLPTILLSGLLAVMLLGLVGCGESAGVSLPPTVTSRPTQPANGGLPTDIPLYPGSQLTGSPAPGQTAFQAPGSPQAVSSYYQAQMPQRGWKTVQVQENGLDGTILAFSKETRTVHMVIAPGAATRQTTVLITITSS